MDRPRVSVTARVAELDAVELHESASLRMTLLLFLALAAIATVVLGTFWFAAGSRGPVLVLGANLLLLGGLAFASREKTLPQHRSVLASIFLVSQGALALFALWQQDPAWRILATVVVLPLAALCFRLKRVHAHVVYGLLWAMTVWVWQTATTGPWKAPAGMGAVLWPTFAILGSWATWGRLSEARRQRFLDAWRLSDVRRREHTRMREEIEAARQIQLDLLPSTTPDVGWLDFSGVSVPASEVGGDYYDYFERDGRSVAVVVGDVAGHGLASGLMLSSLRSCLYLLRGELDHPAEVLVRLDAMVRHTSSRRMLVTLVAAWVDAGDRSLTLASAAHPPALIYSRAGGRVRQVDLPALPLGTRLGARFRQRTLSLEEGDVVVLYTDGLLEMASGSGELYGAERLGESVAAAASRNGTAREVRDYLLADFANFKGDVRRDDDVTVVVVKVR